MNWIAIGHGALTGAFGAAAADIHAFLTWKKIQEAVTFDWGTAVLRWCQGAVAGAVTAAGYGALIS